MHTYWMFWVQALDSYKIPVLLKSSVLWNITLCSPLKVSRHFGGTSIDHQWTSRCYILFITTVRMQIPSNLTLQVQDLMSDVSVKFHMHKLYGVQGLDPKFKRTQCWIISPTGKLHTNHIWWFMKHNMVLILSKGNSSFDWFGFKV
jgi:hypothetical protein